MEDSSLRIHTSEQIPSAEEFASQIEPKNVPAVFNGCIKNWKAFSAWNPCKGGLDYLQGRVGSSVVEAMLSKSAPVFYGDIRSHERVPLPFSIFIGYCKDLPHKRDDDHVVCIKKEMNGVALSEREEGLLAPEYSPQQVYLAQVPIMNIENEERVQLESLREDIQLPSFLETRSLASANLWMNSSRARSSTHYDPHHNLLCIIAGRKEVVLWPPSASPFLYPMPLYGEASNHSAITLGKIDHSIHPRAEHATECSQKVTLHAGDALFIPEGWFHQVDSDDLTIAVNFWWRSDTMSGMLEHMDAYYLRRILRRLTDQEMNQVLCKRLTGVGHVVPNSSVQPDNGKTDHGGQNLDENHLSKVLKGKKMKQRIILHEMEPLALQSLHGLISLVHDHVNVSDHSQAVNSSSISSLSVGEEAEFKKIVRPDYYHLEDDQVASILWTLQPLTLQSVFLAMAQNFPRSLEALILHLLSPVGAEVLTRKFDEMDLLMAEEDRNEFYQIFYGVFDDQLAAMDALLNGKESFALQAFKSVLGKYLGIPFNGSKRWVE